MSKMGLMRKYSLAYVLVLTLLALTLPNPELPLAKGVKPVIKLVEGYAQRKFSEKSVTHRFAFSSGLTLFLAKMGYAFLFVASAGLGTVAWFFDIGSVVRHTGGITWLLNPLVFAVFVLELAAAVEANALSWLIFFGKLRREALLKQTRRSLTLVTVLMAVATVVESWYLGLSPVPRY